MKSSKNVTLEYIPALDHIHLTLNNTITYMNSYFSLLKVVDDKMIREKRNNDFNLSGEC